MDLFLNQKVDYAEFCEDVYENYQEIDTGEPVIVYPDDLTIDWVPNNLDTVWFDEVTGELCLKLQPQAERFQTKLQGKILTS